FDSTGHLTEQFFTGVVGKPFTSLQNDFDQTGRVIEKVFYAGAAVYEDEVFNSGGTLAGTKYFYTGVVGKLYTAYELDYDGGNHLVRADYTGVTGRAFSSFERDYVCGVFAGTSFEFTTVPSGAPYSSYETDYDRANVYLGKKVFYTNVIDQPYTGKEVDYEAQDKVSRILATGVSGKPYTSYEYDYEAGILVGYKLFYIGGTGSLYSSQERDYSASHVLQKVIDTGMTSGTASSLEWDYTGGTVSDVIYDYTNSPGSTYFGYR